MPIFAKQHFPSAKSVQVISGVWTKNNGDTANADTASDFYDSKVLSNIKWDAEHYDATVETARKPYALPIYKQYNSDIYSTYYDEFYQVTNIVSDGRYQSMVDWCSVNGVDIEEFFIHFSYDTDFLNDTTPLTIKGWDPANDRNGDKMITGADLPLVNSSATATTPLEARVIDRNWVGSSGYLTWRVNLKNNNYCLWSLAYLRNNVSKLGFDGEETDTLQFGGRMFDPDIHVSTTGPSGINSGNTLEYSITDWTGYPTSDRRDTVVKQDYIDFFRYIKTNALNEKIGGNISAIASFWEVEKLSDHMRREDMFGALYYNRIQRASLQLGRFSARGGKNFVQHMLTLYSYLPNTVETWNRDKLLGLASFYVVQNPQYDYFNSQATYTYGCNDLASGTIYSVFGNIPRNQAFYTKALEVDIGQPTQSIPIGYSPVQLYLDRDFGGSGWDNYSNQNTLIDGTPVYANYSYVYDNGPSETLESSYPSVGSFVLITVPVYARNYTKGLVLVRPIPTWSMITNVNNLGDTHALTIQLPKTYRPVNADGTLSAQTNTVNIRISEGIILVDPDSSSSDTTPLSAPKKLRIKVR